MRYRLEFRNYARVVVIHTNQPLGQDEKKAQEIVDGLVSMARNRPELGILQIKWHGYYIKIKKAEVFAWKPLLESVLFFIQFNIAPQEEMVEVDKPITVYINNFGIIRQNKISRWKLRHRAPIEFK